jgi:hypothetical protein
MCNFMKHLLVIITLLSSTTAAYAKCTFGGLSVFPRGQEIKQNSIFIIEGYSQSQNIILGLNKKHNIYLKSGSRKIKLLVTKILVGQFSLTQALLKPEFVLQAGLEYTMYIDNMPEYETLTNYNRKTYEHEVVKYKVLPENDIEKPQIASKPKEIKKTLVHYGCGPSIHVVFSNPSKDKSEIIIMTTLKNLNTKKEVSYLLCSSDKYNFQFL